jgi:FkbM family methyltransferase
MINLAKKIIITLLHKTVRARTPSHLHGIDAVFNTPTPDFYRRIQNFGGEKEQLELFLDYVKEGDVIWDVGAFIGLFSVFASKAVGDKGKVYAFEPEEATAKKLDANCKLNKLNNITIVNYALSNTDKAGKLYPANEGQNAIHSLQPHAGVSQDGVEINLKRGDSLVADKVLERPNVIKLDVEGAELQSLQGMTEILKDPGCHFIFLELHHRDLPRFDANEDEVYKIFQESGFKISKEMKRGTESHLFWLKE